MNLLQAKTALVTGTASAIAAAVEGFGSLDVCFANAGISGGLSSSLPVVLHRD